MCMTYSHMDGQDRKDEKRKHQSLSFLAACVKFLHLVQPLYSSLYPVHPAYPCSLLNNRELLFPLTT